MPIDGSRTICAATIAPQVAKTHIVGYGGDSNRRAYGWMRPVEGLAAGGGDHPLGLVSSGRMASIFIYMRLFVTRYRDPMKRVARGDYAYGYPPALRLPLTKIIARDSLKPWVRMSYRRCPPPTSCLAREVRLESLRAGG